MPLVVTAGVPNLIPPGLIALDDIKSKENYDLSPTSEFLFVVMCIKSNILSALVPVKS